LEVNIKMDFKEVAWWSVNWMNVAEGRRKLLAVVSMTMKVYFLEMWEILDYVRNC
jgi:hypothetical protein